MANPKRGRPPSGAVWDGERYALPPEALELAAARVQQHRVACRDRYRATRAALIRAKPELFSKHGRGRAGKVVRQTECPLSEGVLESVSEAGDSGSSEGR